MGRFYSGDIEGKFWFGMQSSDCADRFGVEGTTPNFLMYYFCEEDLAGVELEIAEIEADLGDKYKKIKDFFESVDGYNDEDLKKAGIEREDVEEYADLELGRKIRDCIKENGSCDFEAEC